MWPLALMIAFTPERQGIDVALVIGRSGEGGVERMLVNTASGLAELGLRVTLVSGSNWIAFQDQLDERVEVMALPWRQPCAELTSVLSQLKPRIAISGKLTDDRLLLAARDRSEQATKVYFRVGNPLGSRARSKAHSRLSAWWQLRGLRRLYRRVDGCIAVSRGNARDLQTELRVPPARTIVLPNPVVTPELLRQSEAIPEHSWFEAGKPPVIIAVGGLRQQKDFTTLLRAFAELRCRRECRLIIVGGGRQAQRLQSLASVLGIARDVDLVGWLANPYPLIRQANALALSSLWEGFGNVLVEALALGTPVVATDCPYGPREILQDGAYGCLVPVADPAAMANALDVTLSAPESGIQLSEATAPYTRRASATAYARALRLDSRR